MESLIQKFEEVIVKSDNFKHGLPEDVCIEKLIIAFQELFPLLRLLGTAFYFVEKDVSGKLDIIKSNQQEKEDIVNLLEFMDFEVETTKKISSKNGTARNALRLKRALYFIELFLTKINDVDKDLKTAAQESYAESLSSYHTWTVRTAVGVAFYTLPTRKKFLEQLKLDTTQPDIFVALVDATQAVRSAMDAFFEKYDLKDI